MGTVNKGGQRRIGVNGIWDGEHTGRWRMRKRFRRRILVISEEEQHRQWWRRIRRGKARKRMPRASSDGPVFLVPPPKLLIRLVAFCFHLKRVVPAFLSHISPSRSRQLGLAKQVIPRLYFEIVIPGFRSFGRSAYVVVVGPYA